MTIICSATIPTMIAPQDDIDEIQIELHGDWKFEEPQQWLDAGTDQTNYHQSWEALLS